MTSVKKLQREYERLCVALGEDPLLGVAARPRNGEEILFWEAVIEGPADSAYTGAWFALTMDFRNAYPFRPPTVKFTHALYHPNVYKDGGICLDILQDEWSPAFQVRTILVSIRSLLDAPNPDSPANVDAAKDFRQLAPEAYAQKVQEHLHTQGCLTTPMPDWYTQMTTNPVG